MANPGAISKCIDQFLVEIVTCAVRGVLAGVIVILASVVMHCYSFNHIHITGVLIISKLPAGLEECLNPSILAIFVDGGRCDNLEAELFSYWNVELSEELCGILWLDVFLVVKGWICIPWLVEAEKILHLNIKL